MEKNPESRRASAHGASHIGHTREKNEDHWVILDHIPFFAVADGIGGHSAGEIASQETIAHLEQSLETLYHSLLPDELTHENLSLILKKAIKNANSWIHHLGNQEVQKEGMGTTLACGLLHDNALIYGHVGDSRLYHFNEELKLLTDDHIKPKEGPTKPSKSLRAPHVLTKAIGPNKHVIPDIGIHPLNLEDTYLFCSDGLSDYVSEKQISDILKTDHSLETKNEALISAALAGGGRDNITCVLFKPN